MLSGGLRCISPCYEKQPGGRELLSRLQANRERIERDLIALPERHYFSPLAHGQYRATASLIHKYVRGKLIDLGCGYAPFRDQLADKVTAYDTLDVRPRIQTTYIGDIQDMHMIADESYDSALSLEVLEHVPDPFKATQEIYRILRPGAVVVISVPHLSRIHDAPNDYYRFTRFGLLYIFTKVGFEVLEIRSKGGLLSFLGHQFSTLFLGTVWGIPVIQQIAWRLNKWLISKPLLAFDQLFDREGFLAAGYVLVAQKPVRIACL